MEPTLYVVFGGKVFEATVGGSRFAWVRKEEAEDCLFPEDAVSIKQDGGSIFFKVFCPFLDWDADTRIPGFLDDSTYVTFDRTSASAVAAAWEAGRRSALAEVRHRFSQLFEE
jgi:hypothetical protein